LGGESPRLVRLRSKLPGCPGFCRRFPHRRLRYRSQAFSTSQRLAPLSTFLPIFRQITLLGFLPSGVCSSFVAPTARRCRHAFLPFLPLVALALFLGRATKGVGSRSLGWPTTPIFSGFKALVHERVDPHQWNSATAPPTDLPLLGFHLLMVYCHVLAEPLFGAPSRLECPGPQGIWNILRFTVFTRRSRCSLARASPHLEVFCHPSTSPLGSRMERETVAGATLPLLGRYPFGSAPNSLPHCHNLPEPRRMSG
jgi:hypothetical protein